MIREYEYEKIFGLVYIILDRYIEYIRYRYNYHQIYIETYTYEYMNDLIINYITYIVLRIIINNRLKTNKNIYKYHTITLHLNNIYLYLKWIHNFQIQKTQSTYKRNATTSIPSMTSFQVNPFKNQSLPSLFLLK